MIYYLAPKSWPWSDSSVCALQEIFESIRKMPIASQEAMLIALIPKINKILEHPDLTPFSHLTTLTLASNSLRASRGYSIKGLCGI